MLYLVAFRRNKIYFTEKDINTEVTDLYSLDEVSIRKIENIQKEYLMGYSIFANREDAVIGREKFLKEKMKCSKSLNKILKYMD